ncbi:MAG: pyruvate kinase [Vicinamibacterales bacterium]
MSAPSTVARTLLADLSRLRAEVAADGATTLALWARALQRPAFEPAAANLAHYLALRRRDVRRLQDRLSRLGLSSLGQSESQVLPALDTILATLAVLAGERRLPSHVRRRHQAGRAAIAREQLRIFGRDPQGPRTRIMVTMPTEAATDPALAARMLAAGGDCARINCAHDGTDIWRAIIRNVRAAAKAAGRQCPIFMDLAGPKVRVTSVAPTGKVRLARGDRFEFGTSPRRSRDAVVQATVSHGEILEALTPGAQVWIDDGKLGAHVVSVTPSRAVLEVFHARDRGERLRAEKGINLPGVDLTIAPLTAKDLVDLDFVAAHADCVGYSFVQRPADVVRLQRELSRRRPNRPLLPVLLKIETTLAVRNLPRLIVAAGGRQAVAVMVARGDLAVEIGLGRLSEIQEQILWICEAAHVPVVWATQVLERLVKDGAASRGEATDAAMGQRAECVMLNKGPHLIDAIAFLDDVLRRMDRHQHKKSAHLGSLGSWSEPQTL